MSKNLLTLRRTSYAANDTERMKLERTGLFHLSALVNRILHGSLVMQMPDDADSPAMQTMIFETADGMLGVIATLRPTRYIDGDLVKTFLGLALINAPEIAKQPCSVAAHPLHVLLAGRGEDGVAMIVCRANKAREYTEKSMYIKAAAIMA